MNDTQTHFVAVCPHCSTALKIRRVFVGQQVQCKHCEKAFVAEDAGLPGTVETGEAAAHPVQTPSTGERIVVTCPTCQTTLSVRRIYIGRQVRCKQCDDTFLVSDPTPGDLPSPSTQPDRFETDGRLESLQLEISHLNQELKLAPTSSRPRSIGPGPSRPSLTSIRPRTSNSKPRMTSSRARLTGSLPSAVASATNTTSYTTVTSRSRPRTSNSW